MINHYLQPFGFYFHSLGGIFIDGLDFRDSDNNLLKDKSYNVFGGYIGIKAAWKFIEGKHFSMVLKTGIILYFTRYETLFSFAFLNFSLPEAPGNHVAMPLELGILF